jgi:hypothetical protein
MEFIDISSPEFGVIAAETESGVLHALGYGFPSRSDAHNAMHNWLLRYPQGIAILVEGREQAGPTDVGGVA